MSRVVVGGEDANRRPGILWPGIWGGGGEGLPKSEKKAKRQVNPAKDLCGWHGGRWPDRTQRAADTGLGRAGKGGQTL